MVSNAKRMKYVSENEFSSSGEDGFDDGGFTHRTRKSTSKSKGLSKNALMARENRLKKKLYISNLEKKVGHLKTENTNFSKVIENQSLLITDLKKEIKYLKSVIANSTDIGKLIKNIHHSTGMSVSTSLDQSLSLNDCISKPKQPIARKTAHPWEETQYPSFPTPESNDLFTDDLFNDLELGLIVGDDFIETTESDENILLKEHNYTTSEDKEDVGVCLHVSKHRVSLEFCSTCSDNAQEAWND